MPQRIEGAKAGKTAQGGPVRILTEEIALTGVLSCPLGASGVIVFSQENRRAGMDSIASVFTRNKIAALFPDFTLFPGEEDQAVSFRAKELEHATLWTRQNPQTAALQIGIFAEGNAVPAALTVAARHPDLVKAVVASGGRPDLAFESLPAVKAPVLLIAAGRDSGSIRSHQRALEKLNGDSTLNIITRASPSFLESGTMEEAAQLAALWFLRHLEHDLDS